jgi:glycerophosphoryl diester phosphodiesterase
MLVTTHHSRRIGRLRKTRVALFAGAVLVALYLVLVVVGGGISPRFDDSFSWDSDSVLLLAHRGVALSVPENSEAALSEAQRLGFLAVEIDARGTRDGELVLFHDKTGRRLLGLDVKFGELTLDQVKGRKLLFAGKETTNSVPTLREVFEKFGKTLKFYLDMKNKKFEDADRIVALIDEFGLHDRTILASVDPLFVAYVEHKYPKVNTALERFDFFQVCLYRLIPKKWKPDYLSGLARKVTPAHVEWLRNEHLLSKRIVYEAEGEDYNRMLKLGIKKILVDYDPSVHSGILTQSGSSARNGSSQQ